MVSWTQEQNMLLSCLLDDITGTEEIVKVRQDFCKMWDCIMSCNSFNIHMYFTGSKAEGLDLPGSDNDYMYDINNSYDIEVSESEQDLVQSTRKNKLLIVKDNVPSAFAMLKCVTLHDQRLLRSVVNMDNNSYLSSQQLVSSLKSERGTRRIQGPSIEGWNEYEDTSKSGTDNVPSILCKVWPTSAAEWKNRPRHCGWPSQQDKEYIEQFGCHFVPVGHPLSARKSLEWRLSFSIAERTLVWSLNHTQVQCYAVMKLILKEFIKRKSSERHKSVLCSYFIKTFLFWQFEGTELSFWQPTNLTSCIMYLLHAFSDCIRKGVLRHYFVPRFNLLDIKLTREAQSELLHLFEMVLEIGVPILEQCDSLSVVFFKFSQVFNINQRIVCKEDNLRHREFNNDSVFMDIFTLELLHSIHMRRDITLYDKMLVEIVRLTTDGNLTTPLPVFTIRHLCRLIATERLYSCFHQGNKCIYHFTKTLNNNVYGTDISSSKLWLATFLLHQGDYCGSLQKVNNALSSIPPYALYSECLKSNGDAKRLYRDTYSVRTSNTICRASESWLIDITPYNRIEHSTGYTISAIDSERGY